MSEPARIGAQRAIVGTALLDQGAAGWLDLEPAAFLDPLCRDAWREIQRLHGEGAPVDPLSVAVAMEAREGVSRREFLAACMAAAKPPDVAEFLAAGLQGDSVTRQTLRTAASVEDLQRQGYEGDALLDELMARLGRISVSRSDVLDSAQLAADEARNVREFWERHSGGVAHDVSVPTGIVPFDQRVGGIPRGLLSILAARPGMGKSTLLRRIARHVARSGAGGALVISLEDPPRDWAQRELADEAGVPIDRIRSRRLSAEELDAVVAASARLEESPRYHLAHATGQQMSSIARMVRGLKRRLGLVFVGLDYAQKLPKPRGVTNLVEAMAENTTVQADMASREDLAWLMACQLRRDVDTRADGGDPTPRLNDLKGTGTHEEAGKMIVGLLRPAKYWSTYPRRHPHHGDPVDPRLLEMHLLKNHQGDDGCVFALDWDRPLGRVTA